MRFICHNRSTDKLLCQVSVRPAGRTPLYKKKKKNEKKKIYSIDRGGTLGSDCFLFCRKKTFFILRLAAKLGIIILLPINYAKITA